MVDYQEMYYKMNRAMEKAINILVEAQRECEEDYLKETDSPTESEDGEENDDAPGMAAGSIFIIVREWYSSGTYSAEESVSLHCKN